MTVLLLDGCRLCAKGEGRTATLNDELAELVGFTPGRIVGDAQDELNEPSERLGGSIDPEPNEIDSSMSDASCDGIIVPISLASALQRSMRSGFGRG